MGGYVIGIQQGAHVFQPGDVVGPQRNHIARVYQQSLGNGGEGGLLLFIEAGGQGVAVFH